MVRFVRHNFVSGVMMDGPFDVIDVLSIGVALCFVLAYLRYHSL